MELHWPGYNYLGPFTKKKNKAPINWLDALAKQHDAEYEKINKRAGSKFEAYTKFNYADEKFISAIRKMMAMGAVGGKGQPSHAACWAALYAFEAKKSMWSGDIETIEEKIDVIEVDLPLNWGGKPPKKFKPGGDASVVINPYPNPWRGGRPYPVHGGGMDDVFGDEPGDDMDIDVGPGVVKKFHAGRAMQTHYIMAPYRTYKQVDIWPIPHVHHKVNVR